MSGKVRAFDSDWRVATLIISVASFMPLVIVNELQSVDKL